MPDKRTHRWLLRIDENAKRVFDYLQSSEKRAIFRHLEEILQAESPYNLGFVETLKDKKFDGLRKFRTGDYRVFFSLEKVKVLHQSHEYEGTLFLVAIRNRKEAY